MTVSANWHYRSRIKAQDNSTKFIAMRASTSSELLYQSLFPRLWSGERLHLLRICTDTPGPPVLMLHGAVGNGRIFYTRRGDRLAPFLASRGFDVFVADFRGRGHSTPHIFPGANWTQLDMIREDIALFRWQIRSLRGNVRQHWLAHSWGGVLMMSHLLRFPAQRADVASLTLFGSKRCIRVHNWHKFLQVSLAWEQFGRLATKLHGYLPGPRYHFGSDDETTFSYEACRGWARPSRWIDPDDGFDYQRAAESVDLPPSLWFAAANDYCLGHPLDVRDFMMECRQPHAPFRLLGRRHGHRMDYDHVSMLTHPNANDDHFPEVCAWLNAHTAKQA